jgi:hypothetical protein
MRHNRSLTIEAQNANSADGRIIFSKNGVESEIVEWANNPLALADDSAIGRAARRGYNTVEHELSHGMSKFSTSINADRARTPVSTINQLNKRPGKNWRVTQGDWDDTLGDLMDSLGAQYEYGGANGWKMGTRIEEGLTEIRARERLRRTLQVDFGVEETAARKLAEDASFGIYDDHVRALRAVAQEARAGRAAANVIDETDAFLRAFGGEVAQTDRADALTRFYMEKWSAEVGPVSARTATGEVLGEDVARDLWVTMKNGVRSDGSMLSREGIQKHRQAWVRAARAFEDDLAAAGLTAEDGVLSIRVGRDISSELPEGMARLLERRIDVVTRVG